MLEVVKVPDHEFPGERDWVVVEADGRRVVFSRESRCDAFLMLEVAAALIRLEKVPA